MQRICGSPKIVQATQVLGLGSIRVDKSVVLGYFPSPHFFSTHGYLEARSISSSIVIGPGTIINNGFTIIAEKSKVIIGKNCLIGTCVEIYDSDFHVLDPVGRAQRAKHASREVTIENDVFIGSNVKILKGVTIGEGAVIGNGSVVVADVPPKSVVRGVPAVVIKVLI